MDRRHDRARARRTRSHGSPPCRRPAASWSRRRAGAWVIREDGSKRRLGEYDRGDVVAERPVRRRHRRLGAPRDRSRRELPLVDRGRRAGDGDRLVARRGLPRRLPGGRRGPSRHGRRTSRDRRSRPAADVPPAWQPETDPARGDPPPDLRGSRTTASSPSTPTRAECSGEPRSTSDPVRLAGMVRRRRAPPASRRDFATIQDDEGGPLFKGPIATGVEHAAISPDGSEIAVVSSGPRGTELSLYSDTAPVRRLYSSGRQNPRRPLRRRRSSRRTASGSSCRGRRPTSGSSSTRRTNA